MSTGTLTDTQRGLHAPVYFIVDRSSSDLILTSPAQPGIYYINLAALMDTVGGEVKVSEIDFDGGIDFNGDTPAASPLLFTGVTLPANSNVIRGIDIVPTRVSGWTAFTGLVGATPAQVYTDYRELHTEGVAEVLGAGQFVFMDSGASCKSLFAEQNIAEVDAGATVLTAAGCRHFRCVEQDPVERGNLQCRRRGGCRVLELPGQRDGCERGRHFHLERRSRQRQDSLADAPDRYRQRVRQQLLRAFRRDGACHCSSRLH